ncbi:2-oxoglutarate dehydrogenase complex dihydrolipoyllysine-residue succinyltransferase [Salinicoccus halitifaciens]|uniref:Dihydrolipoyllysine-residue succinyltransferase component of 2-oxoglutarate dehydrogenase complex n=1 Tax=Salinicoccus halitifaciens TaxID=1073415 RepID=A0ABV2E669_9STAP|nr:2-oxoglutarate dehydrogenase complex dihydrolipoyllysine-residue succinyltransferase [Salinicoccus halitifaciens]MCD2137013.1 2-oxoglutarate dehydrogenase complex dihydrolipoyllysine-residue succinyltransferase [Salinicoccus halitifaciens]
MAEVKIPELAESITEGTIASWLKGVGDSVEKGENILELETDKVNVEVISEESGVITELRAEEGDTVEVGQVVAVVDESGEASSSEEKEESTPSESKDEEKDAPSKDEKKDEPKEEKKEESGEASDEGSDRIVASPAARKLAREKGLSLKEISAGDPRGHVRSQDVENHEASKKNQEAESKKSESKPEKQQANAQPEKPVIREKMSRRRQTIAKRLHEVKQNTAMLTTFNEVDMTNVMELRKRKKEAFQEKHDGTRLGFMSFFTKASVAALRQFPAVNAEIDGDEMIYKQFYDIGIAVSTEEGLVVPVVRDCDRKTFAEIEADIAGLATKAIDKKLSLDEMTGGSFTITNGGVFGSLLSTPIMNGTQAGILGMHTIQKRPVAMPDGSIEVRPMMYIALSYDHRVIDGKDSVNFLKTIKELIENPEDLLLEG